MKKITLLIALLFLLGNLNAQLSFSYKALPNEHITPYLYLWSIAGEPAGSEPAYILWDAPEPPAPWLVEVSPDSFTMQSCADIRVIRVEIVAPAQTGFKSTELQDLAAPPASNISLSLTITNSPTADTTINITAMAGEEITLFFPVRSELPAVAFGCDTMTYNVPDSLQKHRFWSPENGTWINFSNDTLEVGPHDTFYKAVKLKSDVTGTFKTYFNRYREYRSFPVRTLIVFKVEGASAIEGPVDILPIIAPPYPNPASDVVSFQVKSGLNDAVYVDLFDWGGRLVYTSDMFSVGPDEQILHCPVGQIPTGNYSYRVCVRRGGVLQYGRFSVIH
jgi:hypothetical protein